jgi:hypothetical protein
MAGILASAATTYPDEGTAAAVRVSIMIDTP